MLVMQVDKFFGAGCKSPLAVKSATRAKRLTRCDSGTNSIVWMKEDTVSFYIVQKFCCSMM